MSTNPLEQAITRYKTAIATLTDASTNQLTEAQVLDILAARDEIQAALANTTQISRQSLTTINQLDSLLKNNAAAIAPVIQSTNWRKSFNPDEKAWWWFLEVPKTVTGWERWDWLWNAFSGSCLTISLGLVGEISSRFLAGGPDTLGAIAVSAQSVLTLLAAGGTLTQVGREAGQKLLKRWKVPQQSWQEMGAGFSGLLLIGLVGLRLSLPQVATWYTNWGWNNYQNGDWSSAEADYHRALQLNRDDALAHFRLGLLYEDLHQLDKARTQYQLALQGERWEAFNNLARLYILDKQYSAAASLLLRAEAIIAKRHLSLDNETRYALLKNLGWVRLMQGDGNEAQTYLEEAIALQSAQKIKNNLAAPYCLLAQVKEAQKQDAYPQWNQCNALVNPIFPEEDEWRRIAQKRITEKLVKEMPK